MFSVLPLTKGLNEKDPAPVGRFTQPDLLAEFGILMETLRSLAPQQTTELMYVPDRIALLNAERNAVWRTPSTLDNTKRAVFMSNGDVYEELDATSLISRQTNYLRQHVHLLSDLHGVLRPLDLVQLYRLEVGMPPVNPRDKNLYESRGDRITSLLNDTLARTGTGVLINLVSQEYFKSIDIRRLNVHLIIPVFKNGKNDKYKIISFYAKRARGLMVCCAVEYGAADPEQLEGFDCEGYRFNEVASGTNGWAFLREEQSK